MLDNIEENERSAVALEKLVPNFASALKSVPQLRLESANSLLSRSVGNKHAKHDLYLQSDMAEFNVLTNGYSALMKSAIRSRTETLMR